MPRLKATAALAPPAEGVRFVPSGTFEAMDRKLHVVRDPDWNPSLYPKGRVVQCP